MQFELYPLVVSLPHRDGYKDNTGDVLNTQNMYFLRFIGDKPPKDPARILSTLMDTVPCKEVRGAGRRRNNSS